eukprot:293442_1
MFISQDPCVYTRIFVLSTVAITWPLYGYLLFKWYQNRNHFVIRLRWPKISLAIVCGAIITHILSIIESSFCMKDLATISMGICNMMSGLVFYRAQLTFVRCLRTRRYWELYIKASENRSIHIKKHEKTGCCDMWTNTILSFAVISSASMITLTYLNMRSLTIILWIITLLIGVICLVNILRHKITDAIGISKEVTVQISCMLFILVVGPFLSSVVPEYIEISYWNGFLVVTLYGFVTLFVVTNLIQKTKENNKIDKNEQNEPSLPPVQLAPPTNKWSDHSVTLDTQSVGLSVPHTTDQHISASMQLELCSVSSNVLQKPLYQFIVNNSHNYSLFAGYLCECFALENLMFLERAIILYHTIIKYQKMDTQFEPETPSNDISELSSKICYSLKFRYLSQIYTDVDQMIVNAKVSKNVDNYMKYKVGIVKVMQILFKQFCCYDSDTEINVSYPTQGCIRALFENKSEEQILNQFKSYEDLMLVFDAAVDECWKMCKSIYGFQFKSYIFVRRNKPKPRASFPGGVNELTPQISNTLEVQKRKSETEPKKFNLSTIPADKAIYEMDITPQLSPKNSTQNSKMHMDSDNQKVRTETEANTMNVTPKTPLLIDTQHEDAEIIAYEMVNVAIN